MKPDGGMHLRNTHNGGLFPTESYLSNCKNMVTSREGQRAEAFVASTLMNIDLVPFESFSVHSIENAAIQDC